MPRKSRNLQPVIVYLPPEAVKGLEARAQEYGGSLSVEARRIIVDALKSASVGDHWKG